MFTHEPTLEDYTGDNNAAAQTEKAYTHKTEVY
jgi:hypothetical protein